MLCLVAGFGGWRKAGSARHLSESYFKMTILPNTLVSAGSFNCKELGDTFLQETHIKLDEDIILNWAYLISGENRGNNSNRWKLVLFSDSKQERINSSQTSPSQNTV